MMEDMSGDFYEDDEPIEEIRAVLNRPVDGFTMPPGPVLTVAQPPQIFGGSSGYAMLSASLPVSVVASTPA